MIQGFLAHAWIVGVLIALGQRGVLAQCEIAKLTEPTSAANEKFARRVGIEGVTTAFGMPGDDFHPIGGVGAAFVSAGVKGAWGPAYKFKASDAATGDSFGWLAITGDRMVVGAFGKKIDEMTHAGAAYYYDRVGGHWIEVQKVWASDPSENALFGYATALSGSTALITAFNDNHGKAYIFERDAGGTWIEKQKLIPVGWMGLDYYGRSAALDGDVAVVGAPVDIEFGFSAGAAHVFERQSDGTWKHVAKLTAPDAGGIANFGIGVAVQGNAVYVGASGAKIGTKLGAGAVYVFERGADAAWTQTAKLFASDFAISDNLGRSVAVDGDVLVASAPGDGDKAPGAGSLYVFTRDAAGTWTETAKLLASDGSADDRLGNDQSLAISGKLCLVGAWRADPYGEDSGAAYLFAVGPDADGDGIMDACECPGDINQDWVVNQSDLGLLLHAFGACPGDAGYHAAAGTLDSGGGPGGDPCVNQSDLGVLLAHYGAVCP